MSKTCWPFDSDDTASRLVGDFRELTRVDCFDLAVVLGSGWQTAADIGTTLGRISYEDWPCFPAGQIQGHNGCLSAVNYSSWNILFFCGRFHYYQGLNAFEAAFPVRLAAAFSCPRILLTCAAGGINKRFSPGDFMLVEDHMNFLGDNPLRGLPGNPFVDLSKTYDVNLYDKISASFQNQYNIHRGVLVAMSGPSYETPAEIRFLSGAGADVVSMSMVPEAIMARYLEMNVAAVAFVSNYAAGILDVPLNHQDVLNCSHNYEDRFPEVVGRIISDWQAQDSGAPK